MVTNICVTGMLILLRIGVHFLGKFLDWVEEK